MFARRCIAQSQKIATRRFISWETREKIGNNAKERIENMLYKISNKAQDFKEANVWCKIGYIYVFGIPIAGLHFGTIGFKESMQEKQCVMCSLANGSAYGVLGGLLWPIAYYTYYCR